MLNTIKENYSDLMSFLRNPKDEVGPMLTLKQKIKTIFIFILIETPIMILLILLINGLEALELVNIEKHAIDELIQTVPTPTLLILIIVIGPLSEEVIFRLYLRYKDNLAIPIMTKLASILGQTNEQQTKNYLFTVWTKRYPFVFYFSAVIFGLVHIFNFDFSFTILLLSPLLVAPQIVLGIIIGYLRVRNGLFTGFLMHSCHNALFAGVAILLAADQTENRDIVTPLYSLKVEKTTNTYANQTCQNYPDSIAYENISLKSTLTYLLNTKEILLQSNNDDLLNQKLNVYFKNKSKDSSKTKSIALNQLAKSFDFKIKKSIEQIEVWNLEVVTPALLSKYKSTNDFYGNLVTINPKEITIKKSSIKTLVDALTKEKKQLYFDKTSVKGNYNLTLETKDSESLRKQLKDKYGLSLVKRKMNLEHITILFPK